MDRQFLLLCQQNYICIILSLIHLLQKGAQLYGLRSRLWNYLYYPQQELADYWNIEATF